MGFLRAVEFARLRPGERLAVQGGFQPVFDHPLAQPMDGGHADLEGVRDLPVAPARAIAIGLQQPPRPQGLVSGHARSHDQLLQGLAFLVSQTDDVLGFLVHGSPLVSGFNSERFIA
jgi:hypothetical protein